MTQTTTPDASDALAAANEKIAALRLSLQQSIGELDESIRSKSDRLAKVLGAVNRKQAAALVADSMRRTLQERRAQMLRQAAAATRLDRHVKTVSCGAVTADGRLVRDEHDQRRLNVLPYDLSALDLASLLLDDAKIEAFAKEAVADAPASGPDVLQLQAEMNTLADELTELHESRRALRERLRGFVDIELSPLVPEDFFARHNSLEHAPEGGVPTVTYADPTWPAITHDPGALQAGTAAGLQDDDDEGETMSVPGFSVGVASADAPSMNPPLGPDRLQAQTPAGADSLDDIVITPAMLKELERGH